MRLFLLLVLASIITYTNTAAQSFARKADSLYKTKNYVASAPLYVQAAITAEFKRAAASHYYNAACSYALAGDKENAFDMLEKAIAAGWNNKTHVLKDTDLGILHNDKQWKKILKSIKEINTSSNDPLKAQLITTDIHNFWDAYDRAQKDTANRLAIYRQYYIDKGTVGLQDYFSSKVHNMKSFIAGHDRRAKFYEAIRKNTLLVESQKPAMIASFVRLKELYPAASFPNIYFVIGNYTSGGTVSPNGLLIGTDQYMKSDDIPLQELNLWEKNNFGSVKDMPHLIAHELIHFNQNNLAQDTTLLAGALREGMADFLGELISGRTANERLFVWTKGRERQVMDDFRKEMYLNRSNNWIGNSHQETADKPADLGYWVGYSISKAYYNNASDKKQAIHDILNIRDYKKFYELSRIDELYPPLKNN